MISQLAQSLAGVLVGWAWVSGSAVFSYLLLHLTRIPVVHRWRMAVWGVYWSLCVFTVKSHPISILLLLTLSIPFCCVGALAEKATRPSGEEWDDQMNFLVGVCLLSVGLGTWMAGWMETTRPLPDWANSYPQNELVTVLGMVATPTAISVCRSLRRSLQVHRVFDQQRAVEEQVSVLQKTGRHSNN